MPMQRGSKLTNANMHYFLLCLAFTASIAFAKTNETTKRQCAMDLIFVVDGSGSIVEEDFVRVKQFLKKTVASLEIGKHASQVGVIQFSSDSKMEFTLNQYSNKQDLESGIDRIEQQGEGTAIADVRLFHFDV